MCLKGHKNTGDEVTGKLKSGTGTRTGNIPGHEQDTHGTSHKTT